MGHITLAQHTQNVGLTIALLQYIIIISTATFALINIFATEDDIDNGILLSLHQEIELLTASIGLGITVFTLTLFMQLIGHFGPNGIPKITFSIGYGIGLFSLVLCSAIFAEVTSRISKSMAKARIRKTD